MKFINLSIPVRKMQDHIKQEFAELLETSVNSMEITYFKETISRERCKRILHLQGHDGETKTHKAALKYDTTDAFAKQRLLEIIRSELSDYLYNDKFLSCTLFLIGDLNPSRPERILRSLWRISIAWNVKKAIEIFIKTIEDNKICFDKRLVLNGLNVESEIRISDGIRIIPLSSSADNLKKDLFIGPFDFFDETLYFSKALLIISCHAAPAFSKPPLERGSRSFCVNTDSELVDDVYYSDFCKMLSLALNQAVTPCLEWNALKEDELLLYEWAASRESADFLELARHNPINTPVSNAQIQECIELCEKFSSLDSSVQKRLTIAISRWMQAKIGRDYVDIIINLGIAFESLYLDSAREQLAFTLRVRAAWYLGNDVEERKMLMKEFGEIYNIRSVAVHTGEFKNKIKKINTRDFIKRAQDLCQMSIVKVIREGRFPDWDSLIMGSSIEPT